MHINSAIGAEALARSGCEAVVVDLQHGHIANADVPALVAAIEAGGAEPFARVSALDPSEIGAMLDAGISGIIAPYVESAGEAELLVRSMHYAPRGRRSYGPLRELLRDGKNHLRNAGRRLVALAMIESRGGVENLEAILNVDGLDGVFVGPADLALSLEEPLWQRSRPFERTIGEILKAARRQGRSAGIFAPSVEAGRMRLEQGFSLVSIPPDSSILMSGFRDSVARLRPHCRNAQ